MLHIASSVYSRCLFVSIEFGYSSLRDRQRTIRLRAQILLGTFQKITSSSEPRIASKIHNEREDIQT
ncbi:hypothetical protein CPB86DRAFT_161861 [Serendipita vermifera]|nr:hypothetical protein CPB86DRAFT_161861 [Serendipita vermifera]